MEQEKSLSSNSAKKRKILIGCAIGGMALIMAGTGIGIGYAIWHSKNSGDTDPRNSLTIEYSGSFDFNDESPVSVTPTIKTSSGGAVTDTTFTLYGTLPNNVSLSSTTGIISGTTSEGASSGSFAVAASALDDGSVLTGKTGWIDWSVTAPPPRPLVNVPLNELIQGNIVDSIDLSNFSMTNNTEPMYWMGWYTPDFAHIASIDLVNFNDIHQLYCQIGSELKVILNGTTWMADGTTFSNDEFAMTFTWTNNDTTKRLDITYGTSRIPVNNLMHWDLLNGGSFSGTTY